MQTTTSVDIFLNSSSKNTVCCNKLVKIWRNNIIFTLQN